MTQRNDLMYRIFIYLFYLHEKPILLMRYNVT